MKMILLKKRDEYHTCFEGECQVRSSKFLKSGSLVKTVNAVKGWLICMSRVDIPQ